MESWLGKYHLFGVNWILHSTNCIHYSFNATLAQNSAVRKEIDHLVQERATFNDMIARLQKKIAGNKKVIADITEMAILAFDKNWQDLNPFETLGELSPESVTRI